MEVDQKPERRRRNVEGVRRGVGEIGRCDDSLNDGLEAVYSDEILRYPPPLPPPSPPPAPSPPSCEGVLGLMREVQLEMEANFGHFHIQRIWQNFAKGIFENSLSCP
jgi:hypothetical protein